MRVVVGLGSNLGDRRGTLASAVAQLARLGRVQAVSRCYETEAVGAPGPRYLNAAVLLESPLEPPALLDALLGIEAAHGRERRERWAPRTLDLDVLWIDGLACSDERLTVPHPALASRSFALLPLLDVAPEAIDPATGARYADLAGRLDVGGIVAVAPRADWAEIR
jgi:2-amino-4-hydroxy-6-hydroxymethyldihydropteridine diphosphokinase